MATGHLIRLDMRMYLKFYECDEIVNDYPYLKKIRLYHNTRLKSSLGVAYLGNYSIALSTRILAETFHNIRETLIHELCHIVAYKSFNAGGHDKIFKNLHRKYLKLDGNPTFHIGRLTTEWVKVNGKWIVQKKDDDKWLRAEQRINEMLKKMSIAA